MRYSRKTVLYDIGSDLNILQISCKLQTEIYRVDISIKNEQKIRFLSWCCKLLRFSSYELACSGSIHDTWRLLQVEAFFTGIILIVSTFKKEWLDRNISFNNMLYRKYSALSSTRTFSVKKDLHKKLDA